MRLALGGGRKKREGRVNVDIKKYPEVDVILDIRSLQEKFQKESADEILMEHVIEHFTYNEARKLLKDCYNILKNGGKIIIFCPDLMKVIPAWLANEQGKRDRFLTTCFYGNQWDYVNDEPDDLYEVHQSGWYDKTLAAELYKLGFKRVVRKKHPPEFLEGDHEWRNYEMILEAEK